MAGNGRRRGDVADLAEIFRERERDQGIRLAPLAFAKPAIRPRPVNVLAPLATGTSRASSLQPVNTASV